MSRTALVTGGSGFIGGHLSERLVDEGWVVRVLDLQEPLLARSVEWVEADVRDTGAVGLAAAGIDALFHLGSVVGVERVFEDPLATIDVTVNGTMSALAAASSERATLIHLSSSEVLGLNAQVPWNEDAVRSLGSALVDRWSYGSAKAAAEHVAIVGARSASIPATVIRPFNVYGPRQQARFVIPAMIAAALSGESIIVHGDGLQTRSFTYVDDVVDAIIRASEKAGLARLVHIGSSDEVSMWTLADRIRDLVGGTSTVSLGCPSDPPGSGFEDIRRRATDCSLACTLLGWTPTTTLDDGLQRTVAWARSEAVDHAVSDG